MHDRRTNSGLIDQAIGDWTTVHGRYQAQAILQAAGVAGAAVQSVADLFSDPQLEHRGSLVYLEHPLIGIEPMPGLAWKLSDTPGQVNSPAPSLGAHTHEVLVGENILDENEYRRLVAAGVIETAPDAQS